MSLSTLLSSKAGVTRRAFTAGTMAVGAATLSAISLSSCSTSGERSEGEPQVVTDSSQIIDALDTYVSADLGITFSNEWTLPLGTQLFHSEGDWAAAMLTPESAQHINTLGIFSLATATLSTLREEAVLGSAYTFYAVRCSAKICAWVEIEYINRAWTLFAQTLSEGALTGEPVTLDSGDIDWEPPSFSCTDTTVIWQKMPLATGSKSTEDSNCYLWNEGEDEGRSIWESHGRFATAPRVSNKVLTITPRVHTDEGTYYGMTALDLADSTHPQLDQLVLPASVKPFEAVYTGSDFVFSIEAEYDSVGSLGSMGTFIGREGGPYIYMSREPEAQVIYKDTRFLIKTQSAHYVIDTEAEQYTSISSPDYALNMGDYPASEGACSSPLVFATIRNSQGIPDHVAARLYNL